MRIYKNGADLFASVLSGVKKLSDNVGSTLGPKGRNVILHYAPDSYPIISKDGVTIAKFFELEDKFENAAVQIVKQAANRTNEEAGDGTTTATILAHSILQNAHKYIVAGVSPIEIKRGMDKALGQLLQVLDENTRQIESEKDIEFIATISANNDSAIGKLVSTAVASVGKDGSVSVKDGKSSETRLDFDEGFAVPSGFSARIFITEVEKAICKYENAFVFVTDEKITTVEEIMPVLQLVAEAKRPLVIVSDLIEDQALASLIVNKQRGSLKVVSIKPPRYGSERRAILEDLAISVGATFFSKLNGTKISDIRLVDFGEVKSVEIGSNYSLFVGGNGEEKLITDRVAEIRDEISKSDNLRECEILQERITRLSSGVAIISVGASTEVEMVELKHRIEDSLEAVRAAILEGYLPGGGVALAKSARMIHAGDEVSESQLVGFKILQAACLEPIKQLSRNAGISSDNIFSKIEDQDFNFGWDFSKEEYCDLVVSGIIDPAKVTKCAVTNAVSVSSTLLTADHAIIETEM